jgi:hypothetical protein
VGLLDGSQRRGEYLTYAGGLLGKRHSPGRARRGQEPPEKLPLTAGQRDSAVYRTLDGRMLAAGRPDV